jgi:hypothetical protein
MNRLRNHSTWLALSLAGFSLLFGFSSCETVGNLASSTHFSQNAYGTDKELKDQSLALIDKAKDRASYSTVADDVAALTQLSHFFDLWKTKGTLSPAFVEQGRKQVSDLFDTLIRTEEDKRARG